MLYPECLSELIESFKKIPGIGEKSAERYALALSELDEDDKDLFIDSINDVKNNLKKCKICGNLTDKDECGICSDESRNSNLICVVEDYKSVIMFEKTGTFKGKYHILNGLISPIDGVYPEDINISSLIDRITDPENTEVIMAIKPSVEGEATSLYIKKILESKKVKVSRLSYGIPVGVDIDYLDSITLDRALLDRKEITD
jgi:recombination protein RecR